MFRSVFQSKTSRVINSVVSSSNVFRIPSTCHTYNSLLNTISKQVFRSGVRSYSSSGPAADGHGAAGGVTWHGTTILCVRKNGTTVMAGDGQVSQGSTVMKGNAKKVRRLNENILVGFAGSTADALTLMERLEKKLEEHPGQLTRACVELAKAWRTDKYLRRLEAVLLVADKDNIYELTGNGDVLEPEVGVMGVGSGGAYAYSAAMALIDQDGVEAEEIARRAMKIAGDICVYTNHSVRLEKIGVGAEPMKKTDGDISNL